MTATGIATISERVMLAEADQPLKRSTRRRVWNELRRNRMAFVSAVFLLVITLMAIGAPWVARQSPTRQSLLNRLEGPSPRYWLGADENGRDIFARLVYGAQYSLFIGVLGTVGGVIAGAIVGLVSGYFGRWVDTLAMRVVDVMFAFPGILLVLLIVSLIGAGIMNLIVALTIWKVPTLSRIVRSSVLSLKNQEFVIAARVLGATHDQIMFRHILPNCMAPIIVYSTLGVAISLLTAASLGFLGLGVQPPTPEWGAMLSTGRQYLREAPHLVMFPGLLIFFTVLSLNFIGDALRDALDPRTHQKGATH